LSTRSFPLAFGAALALIPASLAAVAPARAVTLPAQFTVENAVPGVTFDIPTAVAFLPGGRMLVAEKRGRVWSVTNGVRAPAPLWQHEAEVLNESDRGLLGIAVDPAYATNHYLYLLYTVDPDTNGVDDNDDGFGRLTRYTVSFADSNVLDPSSRTVLMGTDWRDGPLSDSPTHTIGTLRFGQDGSLLVSVGEGAYIDQADGGGSDPDAFGPGKTDPLEDIGAFRAQWIGSLAGKILRLNPADGHGYPSNPYWDGNPRSIRSRVWCYGLRNPFRFAIRPGSGSALPSAGDPGTLFIGDVGWNTWEEQDIARGGGLNFGWPCYEGLLAQSSYQALNPAHHSCDSLGLGDNTGVLTAPTLCFHHSSGLLSTPPGPAGNTAVGGTFYGASLYPALYQGRYFYADYGHDWIRFAQLGANDSIVTTSAFADLADGPVDLEVIPGSGDLVYVAIVAGEVRRIRWTGQVGVNNPPLAMASGVPTLGSAPLTVSFSSEGTVDPDLDPLTLSWNFGDGLGSSAASPSHTYLAGGTFAAVLTADDGAGGIGRDTVIVTVAGGGGPFPGTALRDDFNRPDGVLGGSWEGAITGAVVAANAAAATCCDILPVWPAGFGGDQEAWCTLQSPASGMPSLLLKVPGSDATSGYLEVRYDAASQHVLLWTFAPSQGLVARGEFPGTLVAGDTLGARAWSNGSVQVFRNGALLGTGSAGDWPFAAGGGRIGFVLRTSAPATIDDFGGGSISLNTAPEATILSPLDHSFFVEGDVLTLQGRGRDAQQSAGSLAFDWRIDLHHNNHVHPGTYVATGVSASYTIPHHDDGTGTWYDIALHVTDSLGLADTMHVAIFEEVDLHPGPVTVLPAFPGTTTPAEYHFKLYNGGRMGAPLSRWRLTGDGVLLAEGDAAVPALDSVAIAVTVPGGLMAPGSHTLRLVADTLAAVVETQEANNASTRPLTVVSGSGVTGAPPAEPPQRLALSAAFPSPAPGRVSLALELPRAARVEYAVHDLQGRRVWGAPSRTIEAGRTVLAWDGVTDAGGHAPPGVYLARVTVDGIALVRPIAHLR
jgi:glucose/arabinose dehydrogenase